MQIAIVKRQPKRRCRIPRRPHPDLDYFFDRLARSEGRTQNGARSETRTRITHSRRHAGIETLFLD